MGAKCGVKLELGRRSAREARRFAERRAVIAAIVIFEETVVRLRGSWLLDGNRCLSDVVVAENSGEEKELL